MYKIVIVSILVINVILGSSQKTGGYHNENNCQNLPKLSYFNDLMSKDLDFKNIDDFKILVKKLQIVNGTNHEIIFQGLKNNIQYYFYLYYYESLSQEITINSFYMSKNKKDIFRFGGIKENEILDCYKQNDI